MATVGAALEEWLMLPCPSGLTPPCGVVIDANERPRKAAKHLASTLPEPPTHARVLLLEDDESFRGVLLELLESEAFEVSICDSYAALRKSIQAHARVVVLADFWGTSHAVLRPDERDEIRDLASRAPTILLTGRSWTRTTDVDALGVSCIMPKPVALDDLILQVRRCLDVAPHARQ
jgi:DNA-binding NtrC family response regulator